MAKSTVPPIWRSAPGPSFTKQFELTMEDHIAVRYARREPLPFGRFAAFITLSTLFAGLIVAFGWWKQGERWVAAAIVTGAVVAGPLLAWLIYGFFRGVFRGFWEGFLKAREVVDIPLEMTLDVTGVSVIIRQQSWFCPWDSFDTIEEDADRYYFWTSKTQAHVLPKRLFEEDEQVELSSCMLKWWGQAPISPPVRVGAKLMIWT